MSPGRPDLLLPVSALRTDTPGQRRHRQLPRLSESSFAPGPQSFESRRGFLDGDDLALVDDASLSARQFMHFDFRSRVSRAVRRRRHVDHASAKPRRVVVPDGPRVLGAQEPVQVSGRLEPVGLGLPGLMAEARVEPRDESGQVGVGLIKRRGAFKPQF